MPENEAQAEAPVPAPKESRPLLTMPGVIIMLVVMGVEALGLFFVFRMFQGDPVETDPIKMEIHMVSMGLFTRKIPRDDLGRYSEEFNLEIALVLNADYGGELPQIKQRLEDSKNLLRDKIYTEIIYPKNPEEFFKPNLLDNFSMEVQRRMNHHLLGSGEGGKELVTDVIFPEIHSLPNPR